MIICQTSTPYDRAMVEARFSHLYFCKSLHTLQRGVSTIAELLVMSLPSFTNLVVKVT